MRTAEFWTTDGGPADRTGHWQEMLSTTHLPWTVEVSDPGFRASVRRQWVDDLALVDCACDPCAGTRSRPQIAATTGEFVTILMTHAGRETVTQGDAEAHLRPGDAVAWTSTRPARFQVWEPLRKRSLQIPRAALDEVGAPTQLATGVRLEASMPAVQLLRIYLDILSGTLADLDAAARTAARNAALELFAGALADVDSPPGPDSARPALRAAMLRHIERHLRDETITAASIAFAHGVSPRTVQRIFHDDGHSVGEVVRLRRLARAREELLRGQHSVTEIANRWGFADSSHFSRSFKGRYGHSPSEHRAVMRRPGERGADVQPAGAAVHSP